MDVTIHFQKAAADDVDIEVPYASLIGSINYCAITTRPDISYAMNKCAQYTSKPMTVHWNAAK